MSHAHVVRLSLALLLSSLGCASSREAGRPPGEPIAPVAPGVTTTAEAHYDTALAELLAHDRAGDWTDASCRAVAAAFESVSEGNRREGRGEIAPALYDAGLALQRCGLPEASRFFERAVARDPQLVRARVQLLAEAAAQRSDRELDASIDELSRLVVESAFQSPEALVVLARLQLRRGSDRAGSGCEGDRECAKKNLQRALAVDDGYLPAYDVLAQYYLARAHAQQADRKGNRQALELAALVTTQAIKRAPGFAPIHNTTGLIRAELGDMSGAAQSFQRAFELDPRSYEALMNFGALNLGFRGFTAAEAAFRRVLSARPDDYDALLGLSLAVRGQIRDGDADKLKEARALLEKARALRPERPESYYNDGILTEEFEARAAESDAQKIEIYRRAIALYATFREKAGQRAELSHAVTRATERAQDIEATMQFLVKP